MEKLPFYERQHIQKLLLQEAKIKYLFDEFVRNVGFQMQKWKSSPGSNTWSRNASIEKSIEKELEQLHDGLLKNMDQFTRDAWNRSNLKTDDLVSAYVKGLPLTEVVKSGMFARNNEALTTFLNRKVENLTLSDRVWAITGTAKDNIEHYLESGLSTGRSANLISQDVRQLLQSPDRRFRRIRNDEGKLILSEPMKNYHPGQGVYRSSFMNAKRLAATNTNEMYRIADHERWNKLDFVLGIEVKRSASNKGPCPVCDPMLGRYPKDYLFKGNHPWCICVATPILQDEDDFIDSLIDEDFSKAEYVEDIPVKSREYLEDKIKEGKLDLDSYLLKDNKAFFTT